MMNKLRAALTKLTAKFGAIPPVRLPCAGLAGSLAPGGKRAHKLTSSRAAGHQVEAKDRFKDKSGKVELEALAQTPLLDFLFSQLTEAKVAFGACAESHWCHCATEPACRSTLNSCAGICCATPPGTIQTLRTILPGSLGASTVAQMPAAQLGGLTPGLFAGLQIPGTSTFIPMGAAASFDEQVNGLRTPVVTPSVLKIFQACLPQLPQGDDGSSRLQLPAAPGTDGPASAVSAKMLSLPTPMTAGSVFNSMLEQAQASAAAPPATAGRFADQASRAGWGGRDK